MEAGQLTGRILEKFWSLRELRLRVFEMTLRRYALGPKVDLVRCGGS